MIFLAHQRFFKHRFNIYFRVLANYTYQLGAITPVGDIIEHAAQAANENTAGSALSSTSLGFIVKDSWGDAVIKARRGPKKQQQSVYLNVKKKDPTHHSGDVDGLIPLSQALADLTVPDDWKVVRDKLRYWCIVRVEAWEVNNARASTEIVIDQDEKTGLSFVSVKAHGCQSDLSNIPGFAAMSLLGRVNLALDYVQKSSFCKGISLSDGDSIQDSLVPYVTGSFKDLSKEKQERSTVAFSSKCKIFSVQGLPCSECNHLLKLHNLKKMRREKRSGVHRNCNKRYMRKEDVVLQLNQQKKQRFNAERRETYWREKFETESLQLEEEDHRDLSTILHNIDKSKVPHEMECLWTQQKSIMATKSKRGYRWHPK